MVCSTIKKIKFCYYLLRKKYREISKTQFLLSFILDLLRDAVKNGDYITVKVALNSSEEYNLDQEVKCL